MKLQLYYEAGDFDYLRNEITENRYIIVDKNGMDLYGEHFDLKTAKELIK